MDAVTKTMPHWLKAKQDTLSVSGSVNPYFIRTIHTLELNEVYMYSHGTKITTSLLDVHIVSMSIQNRVCLHACSPARYLCKYSHQLWSQGHVLPSLWCHVCTTETFTHTSMVSMDLVTEVHQIQLHLEGYLTICSLL